MKKLRAIYVVFFLFLFVMMLSISTLYIYSVTTLKETLLQEAQIQMDYTTNQMQSKIADFEMEAQYILDSDVVDHMQQTLMGEYDAYAYVQNEMELKDYLVRRQQTNVGVDDFTFYWKDTGKVITTRSVSQVDKELLKNPEDNVWTIKNGMIYFCRQYKTSYSNQDDEPYLFIRMESDFMFRLKNMTSSFMKGGTIFIDNEGKSLFALDADERELLQQKDKYLTENGISEKIQISSGEYQIIASEQLKNNIWLVTYYPVSTMLSSVNFITRLFAVMLSILVIISLSILVLYYKNITRMMQILTGKLHEVEQGNLEATIDEHTKNEFTYVFEQFNYMVVRIRLLLQESVKEQKLRSQAEMRQLQLQIQPHFLYNCLSYIVTVANNPDAVTKMAVHLSRYYRYSTRKKSSTTIGEEIDYAKSYLEIMAMRKQIEYEIVVEESLHEIKFIPLILQPIIENAIAHAIEEREEATHIKVEITMGANERLRFFVSDDGYGLTEEQIQELRARLAKRNREENESVGLWNVNQRLVNYYGTESALTFSQSEWGGLTVSFEIEFGGQDESIDC